jgi:peroxiredoxin Q/BCP
MIETGTEAPDFTLPDQDGSDVALSSLRGGKVVLYFYPKADTPGCTTQACGIRDRSASTRTPARPSRRLARPGQGGQEVPRQAVAELHLLADEDHAVAEQYGVWAEKSMYGKTSWGSLRATFILDEDGVVRHVIPKASPKTHDDEVLAALAELG